MKKLSNYKLRAHHSLCIQFFVGKGYSDDFVNQMSQTIACLNEKNPLITVVDECDVICELCPNNLNGLCKSELKVCGIDDRCFEAYGIKPGEKMSWYELKCLAFDRIILKNRLNDVCGDCEWRGICLSNNKN